MRDILDHVAHELMADSLDYSSVKTCCDQFYSTLMSCINQKESLAWETAIHTANGKAISPNEAALCAKEFMRTRQFIRGIYEAIKKAQSSFPNERINILYAGTGPFATLMLPMTSLFSSEEVSFTLMEINGESVAHLSQIIECFNLHDYIDSIIQADASTYQLNTRGVHHILLTETMQQALKKEPQIPITLNLLPQIHSDGLLIPENISVSVALIDHNRNYERMLGESEAVNDYLFDLGCILDFNKETAMTILREVQSSNNRTYFSCNTIHVPTDIEPRYLRSMNLMTEIRIFNNVMLKNYECSLNLPRVVTRDSNLISSLETISFEYVLTDTPQFTWCY